VEYSFSFLFLSKNFPHKILILWYKIPPKEFDSTFNPLLLLACAAVDIGIAMRDQVKKLADPVERDRIKRLLSA
jgi:hypothetical protein